MLRWHLRTRGSSGSAARRFAAPLHITCWQMVNHRGFTKDLNPFVHCPEELSEKYLICWLSIDKKKKKKKKKCHLKYWQGNGYGKTEDIQPQMSQKNVLRTLYSHQLWARPWKCVQTTPQHGHAKMWISQQVVLLHHVPLNTFFLSDSSLDIQLDLIPTPVSSASRVHPRAHSQQQKSCAT